MTKTETKIHTFEFFRQIKQTFPVTSFFTTRNLHFLSVNIQYYIMHMHSLLFDYFKVVFILLSVFMLKKISE